MREICRIYIIALIFIVIVCQENHNPEAPDVFEPSESFVSEEDTFLITTTDPDGDSVRYMVNWGDSNFARWSVYRASGETIQFTHKYASAGVYQISALAQDINGDTSQWSEPCSTIILIEIPQKWEFSYEPGNIPSIGVPAIGDDGTIYFALNNVLVALHPSGSQMWSYTASCSKISSPSIGNDGSIYIAGDDYIALNPDGTMKWIYTPVFGGIPTAGAIGGNGTIYFGTDDSCLYALNPDGSLNWFYKSLGCIRVPPIISQGGIIFFGTDNGYIYAIASDGGLVWRLRLSSDYCYPKAIAEDTTIFAITNAGLYAIKPAGAVKWFCVIQDLSPELGPVVGPDGVIYISSGNILYVISPSGSVIKSSTRGWGKYPTITQNNYIIIPGTVPGNIGLESTFEVYQVTTEIIPSARSRNVLWGKECVVIANDGTIYAAGAMIAYGLGYIFSLESRYPPASAGWPMYQHDAKHTGRAD
ncbi:MAG: PQQ-binding-like beta-propeller repeat protein [candidate division WOR-3 bacterium]|nr:PQQ-binding-like beta-propeller repeat protein [candidate division WOR-3 bacterium]